jgi:Tfp pilus assembly protein PilO
MTGRDRIVVMVVAVIAVVGAAWVLVVSPERDKANKVQAQVSTAKTQLASAENELANAHSAQKQYAAAYAAIVRLGKAVPADQEVPSLMYQVAQASGKKKIEFQSIVAGAPGSGPAAGAGASASASASSASVTPAAFTQMPFTFVFNGTYFDLEKLLHNLDSFTVRSTSGGLHVSGRLLTIQSIKLAPKTETSNKESSKQELSGTITATAYVLPASQGLTGGATPSSPSTTTASGTTTASTGSSSPVPTASVTP